MTAPASTVEQRPAAILPPAGQAWAFNSAALYAAVEQRRRDCGISSREVMRQAGAGTPSTMTRLAGGHHISLDVFLRLLMWLGCTDVRPFITTAPARDEAADA